MILLITGAAAAMFFSGCGGGEEESAKTPPPSERAAKPAPLAKDPSPRSTARSRAVPPSEAKPAQPVERKSIGDELRAETQLPAYYPDDAPVYPGTKPARASTRNGRASVMFGTPDDPDKVANYMGEYLAEQGWSPASEREKNRVLMQGTKSGRQITVLVARTDEGQPSEITMIAVSVDE